MPYWHIENDNGVVTATYCNPPMNYFCAEGAQELAGHIAQWQDPSVRAVILCGGTGGGFITHYSVEELLALASDPGQLSAVGTALNRNYHALLRSLRELPKLVVAAMNGNTMGGGFELSLWCDIRVGENGDHRYGLPEVRLGILPGGSGTQMLSRLIGLAHASEFVLRGRVVDPATALQLGLVNELADDAVARARAIAREVAALPAAALANAKRALYQGFDAPLPAGLETEGAAFFEVMHSEGARRRMQAYVDQPLPARRSWLESPQP